MSSSQVDHRDQALKSAAQFDSFSTAFSVAFSVAVSVAFSAVFEPDFSSSAISQPWNAILHKCLNFLGSSQAIGAAAINVAGLAGGATQATAVVLGSNCVSTPGRDGTCFNGMLFDGLPIGPCLTDTTGQRQADCAPDLAVAGASCTTPIDTVALGLIGTV
jgi:hypothetical protein